MTTNVSLGLISVRFWEQHFLLSIIPHVNIKRNDCLERKERTPNKHNISKFPILLSNAW